ncbi:hypothetical protein [Phytohabitans suffuscus]|nr:hypothetical protein [Phytohabitans suffuscus]
MTTWNAVRIAPVSLATTPVPVPSTRSPPPIRSTTTIEGATAW